MRGGEQSEGGRAPPGGGREGGMRGAGRERETAPLRAVEGRGGFASGSEALRFGASRSEGGLEAAEERAEAYRRVLGRTNKLSDAGKARVRATLPRVGYLWL